VGDPKAAVGEADFGRRALDDVDLDPGGARPRRNAGSTTRSELMTTIEIANKLVELCKQGKHSDAKALYAEDAVSGQSCALAV